ncbi:tRNA uracil 4-sulfurtransferase ThiI [Pontibacterium granulatum]|uniref:tRNA uracil 4-sulfurtransferase ThiI n=1 Tax=Pontibacterium granulatum TaxID=2036029 RepID=UPI00249B88B6|nr:tRNA uracil 4-sulfurtransferase ThiI [Pontibacterium granulatum]MDI3322932.1 tRNA uracil 4-sulfurtransferase ThiI [Pontibacterium granulatum]
MKFIAKLFPEITIKSRPVRKRMIQRLQSNIHNILKRTSEEIRVQGFWDKVEISLDDNSAEMRDLIIDELKRTPGVAHFIEVQEFPLGDFDNVFQLTRDAYADRIKGKTFKVRVKRSGTHDFKSPELERYVGGGLREHTEAAGVDVHNPDVWVDLEIKDQKLFIVQETFKGLGGYPLGSQQEVLSLISGGFDSVVASYMTMRRGCKTHFLFFNLGGAAHEIGVKQVALYLWQKFGSSSRVKFVTVPFEEVVGEILQSVHHSHMGVVLKRMMMRAGEQVANRMKIEALVTGESIAQVSSQTLPNLALIDAATDKLVVRPLVVMDKQDIIDVAMDIGTYDFAKCMPEYCGVISDRPTTHAKIDRVEEEEANFDDEVLEKALQAAQIISIHDIVEDVNSHAKVEALSKVSENQVIIDIRAPHEQEKKPLNMPGCEVLAIPFYSLGSKVESLASDKEYLLYCEKGVMSQMHAQQLQDSGYQNIKVFRPVVQ